MSVRKLSAVILAGVMTRFLAACAANEFEWVVKIDDTFIEKNAYVAAQLEACMEAQTVLSVDEKDEDWIKEKTIDYLKEYCFINKEFEARGLEIDPDSENIIVEFADEGWGSVCALYENNGITKEYYTEYLRYLYKEQLLFNDIYMPGGEKEVSEEEIDSYLANNLCSLQAFAVPVINDDGAPLSEDQRDILEDIVQNALTQANEGVDMRIVAGDCLSVAGPLLGSTEDYSDGSLYLAKGYLSRSSAGFPRRLIRQIFRREEESCGVYLADEYYYIYKKLSLKDNEREYMQLAQNAVNTLKSEDFDNMIRRRCRDMKVEENPSAVDFLKSSKLNLTF